jgi:CHAT domain-containing protein
VRSKERVCKPSFYKKLLFMPGKVGFLFLAFLLFSFSNYSHPGSPEKEIIRLYQKADRLFNLPNSSDHTDSLARIGFNRVIDRLVSQNAYRNDTLLFLSYLKLGILMDVKLDYQMAKADYLKAMGVYQLTTGINDSFYFRNMVYLGTTYYNLNNFDSANFFLLKAEAFPNHFPVPIDRARLYNALGALYYDNGNYYQSKNYFGKGLEIIEDNQPTDTLSKVSISTNIATSCFRLGQYQESLKIYRQILAYHVLSNYIYMNMGRANAELNHFQQALACFRKVSPGEVPGVLNEMARTQWELARPDSANRYLDLFQISAKKLGSKINPLDIGVNEFYRSELLSSQQLYPEALECLQHAILIFSGNFKNTDLYSNPSVFTGTFAYYKLFDALFKKALAFGRLYELEGKEKYLLASFSSYQSGLSLLDYIEKNYDTDDAKLLLKKKSREIYEKALKACLELDRLHPKDHYLEKAFLISEKNKGSIIAASLQERDFTSSRKGRSTELLKKERNIKFNIARLNVKSDQSQDSHDLESLNKEKSDDEIELSRLQKEFEENDAYYRIKYDDRYPGVAELQSALQADQALISFYFTDTSLHIFILTRSDFIHRQVDSLPSLEKDIQYWLDQLKGTVNGRKFIGKETGSRLYRRLIKPIQSAIPGKMEWVIIPDGILYYLPFESLPGESGSETILETAAISYQFSSRFIIGSASKKRSESSYSVLSFAPFAGKDTDRNQSSGLGQLPASANEIAGLRGASFLDSEATKEQFLKQINKYPVVHLATHAVADLNNPSASFVAFFPEKKTREGDRLFLEELYGLNMDSTELVIISACETGKGELVNNEGVISLARAFIYAGCASTINSLWKADDRSTSTILRQFHKYLQLGYSKSKSLQLSKLDYIHGNSLYKSPDYWSNLILIGDAEPILERKNPFEKWGLVCLFVLAFAGVGYLIWVRTRKNQKEKSTLSKDSGF